MYGAKRNACRIPVGKIEKERDNSEDLDVCGRIILR
jgi:hypothetical protein